MNDRIDIRGSDLQRIAQMAEHHSAVHIEIAHHELGWTSFESSPPHDRRRAYMVVFQQGDGASLAVLYISGRPSVSSRDTADVVIVEERGQKQ